MSIQVQCTCGQKLSLKDEFAGKRVKCPQCSSILTIPAASATTQVPPSEKPAQVAAPVVAPPVTPTAPAGLGSLFDEEEIGVAAGQTAVPGQSKPCPNCHKLATIGAIVCVECGWSFAENRLLETKRAPKKRTAENRYGFDEYSQHEDCMYTSKRRGGSRDSGNRRGPAWEDDDNLVTKYFQTLIEIIVAPHVAFSNMRWYGGLGPPITFVLTGYVFSYLMTMLVIFALFAITGKVPGGLPRQFAPGESAAFGAGLICSMVVGAFCVLVAGAIIFPLPMIIWSGVVHVCLMIVGGAKKTYEATFRAEGYVTGAMILSMVLFRFMPEVVGALASIIQVIYTCIALKYTHEIQWWQAVVASILSIIAEIALIVGIIVLWYMAMGLEAGEEFFP